MTGPKPSTTLKTNQINQLTDRGLLLIFVLGAALRLVHVLWLDFPLNDGGFFYQLILDLQAAGFRLPVYTSYNQQNIPYAYPPLPIYLSTFLIETFEISPLQVLRLLPAIISILTIPAFYLLARTLLPSSRQALFATLGFAFLPTAFDWLVVGGGLTRAFGYLFAILALWQISLLARSRSIRPVLGAILFASLTVLSHPGTTWFTLYAAIILLAFNFKWDWRWLLRFLWVGLGVTVLTAPWWITLIQRHGLEVLLFPFQTETLSLASLLTPFTFLFTNEPLLDLLAFCGLLGIIVNLQHRQYFLPLWLLATFIFESRLGPTYAVVPFSLLIGWGLDQVIWPLLNTRNHTRTTRHLPRIFTTFFLVYICLNAYLGVDYHTVSPQERLALTWIAENTPSDSRFLVLSGEPQYGIDPISEWFPALSKRTSLTTPQAHEWLPDHEFTQRIRLHETLQESFLTCPLPDLSCTLAWAEENHLDFTHIYIPASDRIQIPLNIHPALTILQDSPGGLVLTLEK